MTTEQIKTPANNIIPPKVQKGEKSMSTTEKNHQVSGIKGVK
jgi:hypothetical protein